MKKMVVDTHTHTIASGHAYSTLIENCTEAAKNGMKMIGMTDHGPKMPGTAGYSYFINFKVIPDVIAGVEVLKGVEANIIDYDGTIDLNKRTLNDMDIVIASLHDICIRPSSVKDNTNAVIGAMKNHCVDIIGHSGNPSFPIDVDEMLKAALEYNVIIEINNSSLGVSRVGSKANCEIIAEKAAKYGNLITLGSDSHICYSIGKLDKAVELVEKANVSEDKIMNTDPMKLKKYLKEKGKLKNRIDYDEI
ncbi:MAG TPA: phosphatase [Clostridiaceae bacterium]|jgi:putative hydrolase|nr:phosphatase [Clostridiaceae bacterium]HBG38198.1 phosphatase [Clostridiaceae bacterium]HBN28709.1 phosphatase [Clostridiaceae bacterium]HBX47434.1 phosphatase [Clostridiaceae bacterium]HCL51007.1 phosphatase [Clostridiaceae bacterium]